MDRDKAGGVGKRLHESQGVQRQPLQGCDVLRTASVRGLSQHKRIWRNEITRTSGLYNYISVTVTIFLWWPEVVKHGFM
ncbi:hypothetical protein SPV1_04843 [Mariprofundus ferrooxydans PV-1]|jgi:hypothetical protein|uniref:Uncharacterized protein n=1 Tax=Mariprofundus ferrooxydans PV-1 TaxID=314345 RepID=Q0F322_9PROT|nr:hypothetical protein SPV1_04843 [Mariprofundus ferrooxydans PV-1]